MNRHLCLIVTTLCSLSLWGQAVAVSDSTNTNSNVVTYTKQIQEIEVVQSRQGGSVNDQGRRLVVDMSDMSAMPKFLGTSDPLRMVQTFAGVTTNSESQAGIHIQGCDDYQTLTSINNSPIYYPNHLLGLFSTFIPEHFTSMTVEQSEHLGTADNRIGGLVNLDTHHLQPKRFGIQGTIGLVNSDLTLQIPCGKKSALWVSARASYINLLYSKLLTMNNMNFNYYFMDYNLTYSIHPTDKDEVMLYGFYSRDKMGLKDTTGMQVGICWQNVVGGIRWSHNLPKGKWQTTASFSGFGNDIGIDIVESLVNTKDRFATVDLKNRLSLRAHNAIMLNLGADYTHYFTYPLEFSAVGLNIPLPPTKGYEHRDEASLSIDMRHDVTDWFAYNVGLHGSIYHSNKWFGAADPRVSLHFYPAQNHDISLHYGMYSQYFHKAGLTGGGLPTDFFLCADSTFAPERAHAVSLRYTSTYLNDMLSLHVEGYFKQLYSVVESFGNVLQLVNKGFHYEDYLMTGDGRNYGMNIMLRKNKGAVTGHISYALGWAVRKFKDLEGIDDYIYSASHERRHDLNIVINSRFCKRWSVGGQFVLASGLPYTRAEEAYIINGHMVCRYSTFNGAHMPLYHRLDISCSCDIIKKADHELGINLSIYNVYYQKNAQFVVYRQNIHPIYGSSLSTIIPSISIYGKF